jgi:hypothetical protein
MASYTIDINERSTKAKHFVQFIEDYAKDNGFVIIQKVPNAETRKAVADARAGRTFRAKSAKALFDSIK